MGGREEGRAGGRARDAEEKECDRVVTEGESRALCMCQDGVCLCSCPQALANISCIK